MDSTHLTHPLLSTFVQFCSLPNPILQNTGSRTQRPGRIPAHSSKGCSLNPAAIPESTGFSSQGVNRLKMGLCPCFHKPPQEYWQLLLAGQAGPSPSPTGPTGPRGCAVSRELWLRRTWEGRCPPASQPSPLLSGTSQRVWLHFLPI